MLHHNGSVMVMSSYKIFEISAVFEPSATHPGSDLRYMPFNVFGIVIFRQVTLITAAWLVCGVTLPIEAPAPVVHESGAVIHFRHD